MTGIGDLDPEDAYDAGDPPGTRLAVIGRIAESLQACDHDDPRRGFRIIDALRLLDNAEASPGMNLRRIRALRSQLESLL